MNDLGYQGQSRHVWSTPPTSTGDLSFFDSEFEPTKLEDISANNCDSMTKEQQEEQE